MAKHKLLFVVGLLTDAAAALENLPVGGIGPDGATQAELDAAGEQCAPCAGDASYHQAQQAWLWIEKALIILRKTS